MATVNGPASSTNNAITVWNGTAGDTVKDSNLTLTGATHPTLTAVGSATDIDVRVQVKGEGEFGVYDDSIRLAGIDAYGDGARLILGNNDLEIGANSVDLFITATDHDVYIDATSIGMGPGIGGIVVTDAGTPTITARGSTNENLALAGKGTGIVLANGYEVVTHAISNAKGDLIAGTADNALSRLAVGSNGQVLTVDSTTATGLKWATSGGGGGGGDVTGPASSTQYELPMFDDTTGKVLAGSGLYTNGSGTMTGGAIGTGVSITTQDVQLNLVDNSDGTKQARFECGTIATGTTRTFTFPNASGTFALTTDLSKSTSQCADIEAVVAPTTSYATQDVRMLPTDGTTPAIPLDCWDFDASSDEYMAFRCRMRQNYGGGGVTLRGVLRFTSATSGTARMEAAFFRLNNVNVGTAKTYDFNGTNVTANGTNGIETYFTITFVTGSDMDSVAAGDEFILLVRRNGDDSTNDTANGDAELSSVLITET